MKLIRHIILFAVLPSIISAQSASDYLPARIGSVWRYQRYTLDSAQKRIASSRRIETDSLAGSRLFGPVRAYVFRNLTNSNRDSLIADVHGDTIAFFNGGYPKEGIKLVSDSLGLGFLPKADNWYPYMKWKSPPMDGHEEELYRHDSTITVDGTEFDLALRITRKRIPPVQVTVPAGYFNVTTPFEIKLSLDWLVWTVLGIKHKPLLTLTTYFYVANGNWIVKETQNTTYFPLTPTDNDSIPQFSIPGYERVLEKMIPTSVDNPGASDARIPDAFTLHQNYPNPFNGTTVIRFDLERRARVSARILDVLGRPVRTWEETEMEAGARSIRWYSGTLPSGVYFVRITCGSVTRVQKMLLHK